MCLDFKKITDSLEVEHDPNLGQTEVHVRVRNSCVFQPRHNALKVPFTTIVRLLLM